MYTNQDYLIHYGVKAKEKFPLALNDSELYFIDMDKESLGSVPQY